jgi:predicted NUDIX family NTP pyrophosphohydrolase
MMNIPKVQKSIFSMMDSQVKFIQSSRGLLNTLDNHPMSGLISESGV